MGHNSVALLHPIRFRQFLITLLECMAGTTGLEPATSAVTGQRSNQLSYVPTMLPQLPASDTGLV